MGVSKTQTIGIPGRINSQSLEDMQVGYISQKYTLDKNTLEFFENVEILKFGQNFEIWSKFWNLVEIFEILKKLGDV